MIVNPATSVDTPKCSEIEGKQPLGELDANVALTTRRIAEIVMLVRRRKDQFLGFSISSREKSMWPFSFR